MTRKVIYVWSSFLFLLTADAQIFTGSPDSKGTKCMDDDEYNLPWIYSVSPNNAATVEWKKDGTTMLTWIVSINDYTYDTSNGYSSTKLVHNNNGNITIKTLTSSDAGVYVCKVTYASSGAILTSPGVTLEISSCEVTTEGSTEGTTSYTTSTTTQSNTTQKQTKQWCGLVDHCIWLVVGCVLGFVIILIIIAVCYFKRKN